MPEPSLGVFGGVVKCFRVLVTQVAVTSRKAAKSRIRLAGLAGFGLFAVDLRVIFFLRKHLRFEVYERKRLRLAGLRGKSAISSTLSAG